MPGTRTVESASEGRAILDKVRQAISTATYCEIVPEKIRPMPNQPRKYFNPEKLQRLAESISEVGQLTAGYVRRIEPDEQGHTHELIDGERRLRAIRLAQVDMYRAMVVEVDDEAAQYLVSVIANFNRVGHTVLEICDTIVVMHEKLKLGMEEIGKSIGYHPIYVTNLYGLRRLAPEVRAMLDPERIKRPLAVTVAIKISTLPAEYQLPLATRALNGELTFARLQGEMKTLSRRHGLGLPSSSTSHVRQAISRKTRSLKVLAKELLDLSKAIPMHALREWGEGRDLCCGDIANAQDFLVRAVQMLERDL